MPARACEPGDDGFINFRGEDGSLTANCEPFSFKGLNWYGSEGVNGVLEGLNHFTMSYYFEFMRKHRFNAMRFLFNHQSVLNNAPIPTTIINPIKNPDLISMETGHGVPYIEMIKVTARTAARSNILVVIAAHRLTPNGWPGNGLWYSDEVPESRVKESWTKLAEELCGDWNVVGVDLYNEPHKATWGQGLATTRWDLAAKRLGDHVLSKCPRWLILVEGIAVGAPEDGGQSRGYWWGENLVGVRSHPIDLVDNSKLIYAPHTYGPSTFMQSYFRERDFPSNLPQVWGQHFLNAKESSGTPFVIGEFGGKGASREDISWQRKAIQYFPTQHVGLFYFCLNPTSEDTGGILDSDWHTPIMLKLDLLSLLPSTDVAKLHQMRAAPPRRSLRPLRQPPRDPPRRRPRHCHRRLPGRARRRERRGLHPRPAPRRRCLRPPSTCSEAPSPSCSKTSGRAWRTRAGPCRPRRTQPSRRWAPCGAWPSAAPRRSPPWPYSSCSAMPSTCAGASLRRSTASSAAGARRRRCTPPTSDRGRSARRARPATRRSRS